MKITQFSKTFLAKATIAFTVLTAILLLVAIWGIEIGDSKIIGQIIATSITLAALSFVSFLVVSFWQK
ncbi:MAG: hypothetical protein K9L85_03875 [Candidatus Peribacteraceae bacterium]|nr:hypothetical protein [Candidatus Gracilibacteria bacterium]MCF7846351.1 hypothetical protein [Candidatus Peribacteraceae bacterium]